MNFFILNILIGLLGFILDKINITNKDINIFKAFDAIQKSLEEINNEKVTNFVNNLINSITNNPLVGYSFIFLIYITPILNLLLLINNTIIYLKDKKIVK